ncbi:MAG: hypothetical protein Q4C49_03650 [Bacillota bacterium]|nr:hypothetical protein [Bacillota bacterium]
MLGILIKKQLLEINASFFVDKKGAKRSKLSTILTILSFMVVVIGILGGMFFFYANLLCRPFCSNGLEWVYFSMMGLISIVLGVFGSVFNTYSNLFLSKDNDLLLSLPIPERTIVTSRLATVFIMGLFYSSIVMIPSILVYYLNIRMSLGPLLFLLDISLIVLFLSCILGYVVGQITKRTKGKSYITVFISLCFIAAYLYVYYSAMGSIQEILQNPEMLAQSMSKYSFLVFFGQAGQGILFPSLLVFGVSIVSCILVTIVLEKSFFTLSQTNSSVSSKKHSKEMVQQSVFKTLVQKELSRFTSSANYMLNCGLGSLLLVVVAGFLWIKGKETILLLQNVFGVDHIETIVFILMSFSGMAMIDITAPSISLEGKNLWIYKSLPVDTWKILLAKLHVHWFVGGIPFVLCWLSFLIVGKPSILMAIVSFVLPFAFMIFASEFGMMIDLLKPNLTWVNEVSVIKQSFSVFVGMFVPMILVAIFGGFYFMKGYMFTFVFLVVCTIVMFVLDILLYFWVKNKGVSLFEKL